ncbi:MAG: hypothetical protein ACTTHU_05515 [Treponema sp.]
MPLRTPKVIQRSSSFPVGKLPKRLVVNSFPSAASATVVLPHGNTTSGQQKN